VSRRRNKPKPGLAHYAAPVAFLVGVTVAVLLVHSAFQSRTSPSTPTISTSVRTSATTTTADRGHRTTKRFYTVQTGDTFGSIAAKQGISVEQLQSLNSGVSSNALQVGQKLRIR
jgi:LysM repeat protein